MTFLVQNSFFWGANRGRGGAVFTPTNSFLLLEVVTSVPLLEKIDQKCDRESADRQTDTLCDGDKLNL